MAGKWAISDDQPITFFVIRRWLWNATPVIRIAL
jgi:hypothetical protein